MPPRLRAALALPALVLVATGLRAGEPEPGPAPVGWTAAESGLIEQTPPRSPDDPDFLFQRPRFTVTFRGGAFRYRAEGQLFDFTTERYTAERSDFLGGGLGAEMGVWVGESLEVVVGVDGAQATVRTEERDWEEEDGSPIRQSTRFRQGPAFQLGLRAFPLGRGESLGRFAWVPARATPFLGAGGGVTRYSFRQWGDFVDEGEQVVFAEDFLSDGTAVLAYGAAGVEVTLRRALALTLEGRYQWGSSELRGDFREFDPLDLSGLRLTAGISVRF